MKSEFNIFFIKKLCLFYARPYIHEQSQQIEHASIITSTFSITNTIEQLPRELQKHKFLKAQKIQTKLCVLHSTALTEQHVCLYCVFNFFILSHENKL